MYCKTFIALVWSIGVLLASGLGLNRCCAAEAGGTPLTAFQPGTLWPDDHGVHTNAHGGGILLHDAVYYWFGEHKIAGTAGNDAHVGVHVYSSQDLYNWKDQGIALKVADDPKSDIAAGCILERPKVIFNAKTGKFVMWFHLEPRGQGYRGARSGVAVSDGPTGPFRYLGSLRPNAGVWPDNVPEAQKAPLTPEESAAMGKHKFSGGSIAPGTEEVIYRRDFARGQMARDMALFVDDDGAAYHIYASEENATIQISKLSDDYLKPAGKYIRVLPGKFNEAPAIFKHGGKYWLITSGTNGWAPCDARLSVADSIWGPWQLVGNPCVGTEHEKKITFESQSTYILPVAGKPGTFIFMADRWRPSNAIDGRYIWLPIQFKEGQPFLAWLDQWDLSFFDKPAARL